MHWLKSSEDENKKVQQYMFFKICAMFKVFKNCIPQ